MAQATESNTTRRSFIAGAAAVAPATAIPISAAAAVSPDAALLALGAALTEANAKRDVAAAEYKKIEAAVLTVTGPRPEHPSCAWHGETWENYLRSELAWLESSKKAKAELGQDAAGERLENCETDSDDLIDRIADTPAKTIDGLRFKATFIEHHGFMSKCIIDELLAGAV